MTRQTPNFEVEIRKVSTYESFLDEYDNPQFIDSNCM